jgi:hypothetical protein
MLKQIYKFLHPKYQNVFLDYKVDMKARYGHGKKAHQGLYSIINENRSEYSGFLKKALAFKETLWQIKEAGLEDNPVNPVWNNGFLPGLDIVGIYTMLAEYKPKKYIEIGSGNSTKVAFKARKEQEIPMEIISIDPMPRAEIDELADQVLRVPFENSDFNLLDTLEEGDVLFVDNSHRILPNSDSTVFFLEVLPRLKKGVIVHIHDIYLPYDYPQFMCDRAYSEQYGLAMFLLANPKKYRTILPNYFISEDEELSSLIAPMWEHKNLVGVEKHGGSFWITIAK